MTTNPQTEALVGEIIGACLMTRTRRLSRVVTSLYDQALRPYGVGAAQFSLLVQIARLGPASRAEIGRANFQDRSTLARNLALLLAEGWVDEIVPERGRARPIVVSAAGRELLAAAAPAWREAQGKARELLGQPGAAALVELADSLPLEAAAE